MSDGDQEHSEVTRARTEPTDALALAYTESLSARPQSGPSRGGGRGCNLEPTEAPGALANTAVAAAWLERTPVDTTDTEIVLDSSARWTGTEDSILAPTREVQPTQENECMPRVQEAIEAMSSWPWHVVFPTEDPAETLISSTIVPPPADPLQVPRDAKAVVVIALFRDTRPAQMLIRNLTQEIDGLPPILVLSIATDREEEEGMDDILRMHSMFHRVGAADAMLQRSTGQELILDMSISLRRANDSLAMMRYEVRRVLVEYDNRKFWPCVHQFFDGFPKMSTANGDTQIREGSQLDQYTLQNRIGRGAFSDVYLAEDLTGRARVAIKVVHKSKLLEIEKVAMFWNEFKLMSELQHPNIVHMLSVGHVRHNVYTVMEYGGSYNLYRHIRGLGRPLRIEEVGHFQRHIASGVAYCHANGCAHRDLKPENIAVRSAQGEGGSPVAKIVDFGCAVRTTRACNDIIGTMPFIAPEVMLTENYQPACVDVWACGVILLEMLCGIGKLSSMICNNEVRPTAENARRFVDFFSDPTSLVECVEADLGNVGTDLFPQATCDLLVGMLNPSPQDRWTSAQMEQSTLSMVTD